MKEKCCICKNVCEVCLHPQPDHRDARELLARQAENEARLQTFHADDSFGEEIRFYADTQAKRFVIARSDDFAAEKPDVFDAAQILSYETYEKDEGGASGHAWAFHLRMKIDAPWFDEIDLELFPQHRPESKDEDWYLECSMRTMDLRVLLRQWTYKPRPGENYLGPIPIVVPEDPSIPDREAPGDGWICACGWKNKGKFCEDCGKPRPSQPVKEV